MVVSFTAETVYVFDTGPLSCFARTGNLEVLHKICGNARCLVTEAVIEELRSGFSCHPQLRAALDADWIDRVGTEGLSEIGAFAEYALALGSTPGKHIGEAATLAWAEVHGATAIIDERAANNIGRQRGVKVHGTLWLIVQALKSGLISERQSIEVVRSMLGIGAWLPFDSAEEFITWARQESLLD